MAGQHAPPWGEAIIGGGRRAVFGGPILGRCAAADGADGRAAIGRLQSVCQSSFGSRARPPRDRPLDAPPSPTIEFKVNSLTTGTTLSTGSYFYSFTRLVFVVHYLDTTDTS